MTHVIARILLRYLAGALVAYGLLDRAAGNAMAFDPDLALLIGAGIGAVVELVYAMARRLGWQT